MAILREKSAVGLTLYIDTFRKNSLNGNICCFPILAEFSEKFEKNKQTNMKKKKQVNLNVCANDCVASFSLMFGR